MDRARLRLRQRATTGAVEPDWRARRASATEVAAAVVAMRPAAAATLVVAVRRRRPRLAALAEGAAERVGARGRNASVDPSLKVQVRIRATAIAWCARWPSIPLARLTLKRRRPPV